MIAFDSKWAVLDTETSGFNADNDRVISLAVVTLNADLSVEESWSTLIDAGVDPGATHIHGITSELLAGAPDFSSVSPKFLEMLEGRVIVAHNASFDMGFLQAEAKRSGFNLNHDGVLCTLNLARRLESGAGAFSLEALARKYSVEQRKAHDAADDTRVLVEIFRNLHQEAKVKELKLYSLGESVTRFKPKPRKVACAYPNPGRWSAGETLMQGMRIAFTGGDESEREALEAKSVELGLDVVSSVSGKTSLLVSDGFSGTKTRKAQEVGCPSVNYDTYRVLIEGPVREAKSN